MSMSISSIRPAAPLAEPSKAGAAASSGSGFGGVFESAIRTLEQTRGEADQAVQKLLTGEGGELHSVALAAQRAEVAFDLGLQVRNKIVSAYQEVMRMQL
jgi:flagellar hook-basal body complex protein FliE